MQATHWNAVRPNRTPMIVAVISSTATRRRRAHYRSDLRTGSKDVTLRFLKTGLQLFQ